MIDLLELVHTSLCTLAASWHEYPACVNCGVTPRGRYCRWLPLVPYSLAHLNTNCDHINCRKEDRELPMPRQKVDPRHRQRVAQACDSCKKRKEKCNGTVPCGQCVTRRREDSCSYTRYGSLSRQRASRESESEIQVSLSTLENIPTPSPGALNSVDTVFANSAPIPKGPRMLRDDKDKFSMPTQKSWT